MIILLSPAKKQNYTAATTPNNCTKPQTLAQINILITQLKKYNQKQLSKLMSISDKLADLNHQRFQDFDVKKFTTKNSIPAAFAFQGDAYQTLNISDFDKKDMDYLQNHLIILSGLYGYLRPLDLIQAYRLEMKTRLSTDNGADLYEFWGDKITKAINKALTTHKNKTIINLASKEYVKSVQFDQINGNVITVDFKEFKNGIYKTIGINAKRARGMMTRYIAKNRIESIDDLKNFTELGYQFAKKASSESELVFLRHL